MLRYYRQKFDAFRSFGQAGVTGADGYLPHSVVYPVATYSPWLADQEFQAAYRIVRPQTLVDLYRCYGL